MTQQQEKAHATSTTPMERRIQPRDNQPHAAEVVIQQSGDEVTFQGVLVNASSSGMCIRHWHKELALGQVARVSSPAFPQAVARVIWNWTVGPVVISGLQKLESRAHSELDSLRANHPFHSGTDAIARMKLRLRLLGIAAALLLVAGWHFRTALLRLWSWS